MKTKEQVIQEAYGIDWSKLSDETKQSIIQQDGNILSFLVKRTEESPFYETVGNGFSRPTSLRGIEYNNGWVSMSESIPIENGNYHMFNGSKIIPIIIKNVTDIDSLKKQYKKDKFTHYQKIEIPKPPIY